MLDGKIVEEYTGTKLSRELSEQRKEAEEIVKAATNPAISKKQKRARAKKTKSDGSKQEAANRRKTKKPSQSKKGAKK